MASDAPLSDAHLSDLSDTEKMSHWILDDCHQLVSVSPDTWHQWCAAHADARVIGRECFNGIEIATLFQGIELCAAKGEPLTFLTFLRTCDGGGTVDFYSSWKEAQAGHAKAVAHFHQVWN